MDAAMTMLCYALTKARQGVDYHAGRRTASCPYCNNRLRIYATMPADDAPRVRFARCQTATCPLAKIGQSIKTVEV